MGLLATLKVMLGVDTVDFQSKMRDSANSVGLFENSFGARSTLVERHGMRLARTAENVALSMQRMSVDATGAVAQLAESAGFGKLAIALGAVGTSYLVLKTATDAVMRSAMDAGKPLGEMVAAIVGDQVATENLVGQIDLFAKRLGTSAEALGVTSAATAENVAGLLALRDSLEKEAVARRDSSEGYKLFLVQTKLANERTTEQNKLHAESVAMLNASREAQARFNAEHGKFVPIGTQVAIALAAGVAKQKEFADETRKMLSVMNAEDLRAKAELLQKQVVAIAQTGGSASQTVAALGGQFEDVVKVAKELGIQLTPQFEMTAEAISKGPGLAMDDLFASFKSMPKEVAESTAASGRALDEMGRTLEGKLKGGFKDGIAGGMSEATKDLEAWAAGATIKIPVELDTAMLQKQIEEIKKGRIPTTTGSAP